jgi:hypothetical protein
MSATGIRMNTNRIAELRSLYKAHSPHSNELTKWTRQSLLDEIKHYHKLRLPLARASVKYGFPSFYKQVLSHFSHQKKDRQALSPFSPPKKDRFAWDRAVFEAIKDRSAFFRLTFHQEYKVELMNILDLRVKCNFPVNNDFMKFHYKLFFSQVVRSFGSWEQALQYANADISKVKKQDLAYRRFLLVKQIATLMEKITDLKPVGQGKNTAWRNAVESVARLKASLDGI